MILRNCAFCTNYEIFPREKRRFSTVSSRAVLATSGFASSRNCVLSARSGGDRTKREQLVHSDGAAATRCAATDPRLEGVTVLIGDCRQAARACRRTSAIAALPRMTAAPIRQLEDFAAVACDHETQRQNIFRICLSAFCFTRLSRLGSPRLPPNTVRAAVAKPGHRRQRFTPVPADARCLR
jgi:hypothetical protein